MGGDARARGGVTSIAALPNRSNGTTDADDSVFTQLALLLLFTPRLSPRCGLSVHVSTFLSIFCFQADAFSKSNVGPFHAADRVPISIADQQS